MAIRIFEMGHRGNGAQPVRPAPFIATQSGTVGASSAASSAFANNTKMVTVQSDEACHVVFGSDPTATTSGFKIAAGAEADFEVQQGHKVAWIAG